MKKAGNLVAPTSTTLQSRVMIYQPSRKPQYAVGEWQTTSYGRCKVTGRLGQRHADIVESILFVAEDRRDMSDGGVELLVDPATLRRTLSDGQYSKSSLERLLNELRSATVEIVTPRMEAKGEKIIGGLIDHVVPSSMTRRNPLTGGERNLWRVRLGVALVMLLECDLFLYYQPAPIARLRYGVSQAVVRHVLSHKNVPAGGWFLDTLLLAVYGGEVDRQKMADGRRRLKKDASGLAKLGIEITGDNRVLRGTVARQRGVLA